MASQMPQLVGPASAQNSQSQSGRDRRPKETQLVGLNSRHVLAAAAAATAVCDVAVVVGRDLRFDVHVAASSPAVAEVIAVVAGTRQGIGRKLGSCWKQPDAVVSTPRRPHWGGRKYLLGLVHQKELCLRCWSR